MDAREGEWLKALTELGDLLDRYGETRWAAHFRECRDELLYLIQKGAPGSRKATVASDIRSVYGGMGSFNDLVICPQNGHPVPANDVHAVNQTLQKLASEVVTAYLVIARARSTRSNPLSTLEIASRPCGALAMTGSSRCSPVWKLYPSLREGRQLREVYDLSWLYQERT